MTFQLSFLRSVRNYWPQACSESYVWHKAMRVSAWLIWRSAYLLMLSTWIFKLEVFSVMEHGVVVSA